MSCVNRSCAFARASAASFLFVRASCNSRSRAARLFCACSISPALPEHALWCNLEGQIQQTEDRDSDKQSEDEAEGRVHCEGNRCSKTTATLVLLPDERSWKEGQLLPDERSWKERLRVDFRKRDRRGYKRPDAGRKRDRRGYKRPDAGKRPKTHSGATGSSRYRKSGGNNQSTGLPSFRRLSFRPQSEHYWPKRHRLH